MPKYSLVVPTVDRAHLLQGTLEALARMDHDSFEIIVSNNCSEDNTDAVIRHWCEVAKNLRCIKPPKRLAMSDHWDFALQHVTGDYFIYVGDDDSLDRNILQALDRFIEDGGADGVYWRQALYYYPDWFEADRAGKLYIAPFTGEKWPVKAESAVQQMFALHFPNTWPIGTSFCFKTSIAHSIRDRYGVFFARPYPDYTSTMMYLPSINDYLYVDMALSVIGKSADSNTAAVMNGPKERLQQFVSEHNGNVFPHVPLNFHLVFNGITECVRTVQLMREPELSEHHIDWVQYFRRIYDALVFEGEPWENKRAESEYWKELRKLPAKQQFQVANYVLRVKAFTMRQKARQAFNRKSAARLSTNGGHQNDVCKKLSNLAECSRELSEHNRQLGYF